ncbi:AraC family transcriptional regulator [Xanthovirga aplysinae]|uniref:AraC family transcriptional regulator n=1 Tax=Xanthovirga aplysinae TaxID=2529853 RepID=UPI0012BC68EB|nr:AraC family transcriptional regulator [Xanthovirga aplysinae]MTI32332.1 AraC family transcriptional regulator [Xanthovirga aplysinae]
MILDNLEYISVQNQVTEFPSHYHETFCISLIHNGIETIDLGFKKMYSEKGSITITNPYEIHSNPLMSSDLQLEFDTIYISKDLMKYLLGGINIIFINRKINNREANQLFLQLKNALDLKDIQTIENLLIQFVNILKEYSEEKAGEYSELGFNNLNHVNNYIESHIAHKLSLEELSNVANINKYGFAKKFKASTGMTPMNYVLMKKVFSSKKLITPNTELTQIAYDYNFSDMAHFSRTFKRYIGISPKSYQKNISSDL